MLRQMLIRDARFPTVTTMSSESGHWGPVIVHHRAMAALLLSIFGALRAAFRSRADLALENLALRQQLANLRRTSGRLARGIDQVPRPP